jgi:hypothetical protein
MPYGTGSARRPAQGASAKHMQMEMIHGLTTVTLGIYHKTRALFPAAQFFCQLLRFIQQPASQGSVIRLNFHQIPDVFFRYKQKMYRRLRVYIMKGQRFTVFVNFFAGDFPGDNFAKNAFTHNSV